MGVLAPAMLGHAVSYEPEDHANLRSFYTLDRTSGEINACLQRVEAVENVSTLSHDGGRIGHCISVHTRSKN